MYVFIRGQALVQSGVTHVFGGHGGSVVGIKHPYPRRRAKKFFQNPHSPAGFWPVTLQECGDPPTVLNLSTLPDKTWRNCLPRPVSVPKCQVEWRCEPFLCGD